MSGKTLTAVAVGGVSKPGKMALLLPIWFLLQSCKTNTTHTHTHTHTDTQTHIFTHNNNPKGKYLHVCICVHGSHCRLDKNTHTQGRMYVCLCAQKFTANMEEEQGNRMKQLEENISLREKLEGVRLLE